MHHLPDIAAQSLWRSILKDWEVSEYSSYVRILSVIPVLGWDLCFHTVDHHLMLVIKYLDSGAI